jgi:hypothetical protein
VSGHAREVTTEQRQLAKKLKLAERPLLLAE